MLNIYCVQKAVEGKSWGWGIQCLEHGAKNSTVYTNIPRHSDMGVQAGHTQKRSPWLGVGSLGSRPESALHDLWGPGQ